MPARGDWLAQRGIERGDTVSAVLAHTLVMLECHYGVPMTGAVRNTQYPVRRRHRLCGAPSPAWRSHCTQKDTES